MPRCEAFGYPTPGATSATEIPFAFDTVAARYGRDLTATDGAAAKAMHNYRVAFAKTGVPEVPGQHAWPRSEAKSDVMMNFTHSGPVAGPDLWKARLDLAEALNNSNEHKAGK